MRYLLLAMLSLVLLAGCDDDNDFNRPGGNEMEPASLTGEIQLHDPGMAIGGETDPRGYILTGDHGRVARQQVDVPAEITPQERERGYPGLIQWGRLYLRHDGSMTSDTLARQRGQQVRVRGTFGLVHAGGVETPARSFPVLNVRSIEPVEATPEPPMQMP
ncbi:MAG: hypothetical protein ACOC93_02285 [Planctomycetota bacterium]